jgi:plastocyanin
VKNLVIAAALLTAASAALAQAPAASDVADGRVIFVKLIEKAPSVYAFEPANYTARPGDVIEFVQAAKAPHNVAFKTVPAGVDLAKLPPSEPLVTEGSTFILRIDSRFKNGKYEVVCQPHEAMQMKSTLTVRGAGR